MLYLNSKIVDVTQFPDKTSQVWKLTDLEDMQFAYITWEFQNEAEFMHLAQLKHLMDSMKLKSYLRITYLPYGRQDKEVSNTATFGLHTFAKLLNSLKFKEVAIDDPHSEIALSLIKNSRVLYPADKVLEAIRTVDADIICYPDKGAKNKYLRVYRDILIPYIYGEKVRDQLTGHITSYKLVGHCKGKNILIVDDICDYGNTFIILTKKLYDAGAKEVNLFVSHGLFSGGIQVLKDCGIKNIYTKEGKIG